MDFLQEEDPENELYGYRQPGPLPILNGKLTHEDSRWCWCDPDVYLDEDGEAYLVVHRDVENECH